jgi:hypothetical protein
MKTIKKNKFSVVLALSIVAVLAGMFLMQPAFAQNTGLIAWNITIEDGTHRPITDSLTAAIYLPGTSTLKTVYSSASRAAIGTALTARLNSAFTFYCDLPAVDIRITDNTTGKVSLFFNVTPSKTLCIPQNTVLAEGSSLYGAIKVVKKTIGHVGDTVCDFQFVTAADQAEQPIDLGAIVPAHARVLDVSTMTTEAFVFSGGATTLVAETGNATSGAQFIGSASIYALDANTSGAAAGAPYVAVNTSASKVWLSATPGANWSTMTDGVVEVIVTYLDVDAIK